MGYEYRLPELVKPIFIEENFTAPFFNTAAEEELTMICEWIKKQSVDKTIVRNVCEFANECILLNNRLSKIAVFDEAAAPLPTEENIRTDARIDIYHAVKGEIFMNYTAMRDVLYCIMREFSTMPFAKARYDTPNEKFCNFLYRFALEWYGESYSIHEMLQMNLEIN